ncbi:MAG TPA: type II toxin-antitoxin system HigB family toxin [Hymenobacter sp.]|jgi:mRNA interferase HigB
MVIISKPRLNEYATRNAQATEALNLWYYLVKAADWSDFNALRQDMPATDYVLNDRYVFNIKGNHYRLIARIIFPVRTLYIRGIFTHAEYDKLSKAQISQL